MDYEWFEPGTVWLVRPLWEREGFPPISCEKAFNGGKGDIDVCWNSRHDPCTSLAKVSYLGEEEVRKEDVGQGIVEPRSVVQCQDLDFSVFYNDSGTL